MEEKEQKQFLELEELVPQASNKAPIGEANKKENPWTKLFKPFEFLGKKGSLVWYILTLIAVAVGWCIFTLIANNGTQLFGWDHSSQYVTFYYDYWDTWNRFFTTGKFTLWDNTTFLGVDNIGSNSYYGLFDPFVIAMVIFPRAWIPQVQTVFTMGKLVISSLLMRSYLKYMGIKEGTARFGGIAYGFSGYMNFMVGFQSFVSAVTWVPLILKGIEKVIKELKPTCLIIGLFLLGITSFFFLVVLCIWGVCYAMFRYFCTIKKRDLRGNLTVLGIGVLSFALGLMLCSFTLLPSLRESSLSGRASSIGSGYLHALINSLKSFDVGKFLSLLFEEVGGHPAREITGLVSFFYPTGGYMYLPMMVPASSYKYDAWTYSIFCYGPFVILFFLAIINSIRKKKFSHLIAVLLCIFLIFTNFAFFFFFAFTGNGYGRWAIVLVPAIIYYGCWAFDDLPEMPISYPIIASVLAIFGSLITFILTKVLLDEGGFSNPNNFTYFIYNGYMTAGAYTSSYKGYSFNTIVTLLYQIGVVTLESIFLVAFYKKKWLWKVFLISISIEAIVMGNMAYVFCGYWDVDLYFNGGTRAREDAVVLANMVKEDNPQGLARSYFDTACTRDGFNVKDPEKNYANFAGFNGTGSFHSLENFEVYDYAVMEHMTNTGSWSVSYDEEWYNPSWSALYANKRYFTDQKLGMRYYVIKDQGYPGFESENVPFGSVLVGEYTGNNSSHYRIYRNENAPVLGYAVDSNRLYYQVSTSEHHNASYFYSYSYMTTQSLDNGSSPFFKMRMAEQTMMKGAIFEDDAVIEGMNIKTPDSLPATGQKLLFNNGYNVYVYTSNTGDYYLAAANSGYRNEGPAYILNHYSNLNQKTTVATFNYKRDTEHVVLTPSEGDYFNEDWEGCYFDMALQITKGKEPRVAIIGDVKDSEGNIKENQLLSFEYLSFRNNDYFDYDLYGMYAKGRVKAIIFCGPGGSGDLSFSRYNVLYKFEYSAIKGYDDYIAENQLKNVVTNPDDSYSFTTSYSSKKVVATSIAYDEGWHVVANGEELETFKIDLGFVGFVAPSGDVKYTMYYETPYLSLGVGLFMAATGIYATFMIYDFVKTLKKKEDVSELVERQAQ